MSYIVRVQLVNEDEHVMFSDFEDPYLGDDTPGTIFRECRAEYGRCDGKVFIDRKDGSVRHVGWTFVKRNTYGDYSRWDEPPPTYLQRAWVTLYREVTPATERVLESADLGGRP